MIISESVERFDIVKEYLETESVNDDITHFSQNINI